MKLHLDSFCFYHFTLCCIHLYLRVLKSAAQLPSFSYANYCSIGTFSNIKVFEMRSLIVKSLKFHIVYLLPSNGFTLISPDNVNAISKYRWLLLHFILLMVSSFKCMFVKKFVNFVGDT